MATRSLKTLKKIVTDSSRQAEATLQRGVNAIGPNVRQRLQAILGPDFEIGFDEGRDRLLFRLTYNVEQEYELYLCLEEDCCDARITLAERVRLLGELYTEAAERLRRDQFYPELRAPAIDDIDLVG